MAGEAPCCCSPVTTSGSTPGSPGTTPLGGHDVTEAANWVGEWWCAALAAVGVEGCHGARAGLSRPLRLGLVCFSGRGPGEVFHDGAKVMGLSQWRSREGALFHTCAYTHWEARPLVDLLALEEPTRTAVARGLGRVGRRDRGTAGQRPRECPDHLGKGTPRLFPPPWGNAAPASTA